MKKSFFLFISIFLLVAFSIVSSFKSFSFDSNKLYKNETSTVVYDSKGQVLFSLGWNRSKPIKLNIIKPSIIDVFLQAEDAEFYAHSGFSMTSILRAMLVNLRKGKITQGGSTISQQLVKIKYLNNEKTITRKIRELFLTVKLEETLTKDKILELYLNNIFLGHRNIGLASASEYYFGKNINNLSYRELSFLAVIIPAPSRLSNYSNKNIKKLINTKIDKLLFKLQKNEKISYKTYKTSLKQKLSFVKKKEDINLVLKLKVLEELENKISKDSHKIFGYKIFTSIDSRIQKRLSSKLAETTYKNTDSISALISMRPSGRIAAYAGFMSKGRSVYDMIDGGARSIDSLIVPFIYSFALEEGFHLSSDIYRPSKKLGLKIKEGGLSMISAFDRKLTHENMRLIYKLGLSPLVNYLSPFKLGFEDESDIFSGKIRISLLDLAVAYNSFNNNGILTSPSIIDRVVDNGGRQVYKRQRKGVRAIDPKANYLIKNLIQSKSKNSAYCAESDEDYDFICIDIHNKLSSVSWFGSIDRKNKVDDEKKELLRSISFKKNLTKDFENVSYFLLEEGGDKKFVPHFL